MRDGDFAYAWAAYKSGAFADLIMPDLEPLSFKAAMTDLLGGVDHDWIVEIRHPVGLALARTMAAGRAIEVQVDWFPWASARDKLEGTAMFLREVGKRFKIFIFAAEADKHFYDRLCRYRMLRNGCKITGYFAGGEHARMYYSAGPG